MEVVSAGMPQWGRDQLIAELTPARNFCGTRERFNEGRDRLIAELRSAIRSRGGNHPPVNAA
jgi:hypothetical protein